MTSVDSYSPPEHSSNRSTNNSTKDNGCSAACETHHVVNSTQGSSSSSSTASLPRHQQHHEQWQQERFYTMERLPTLVLQLLAATGWPRDREGLPTQHVSDGPQPLQRRGTALRGARCYCATVHRHGLLHCKHDHRECQLPLVCVRRHCGAAAYTFTKRDRERARERQEGYYKLQASPKGQLYSTIDSHVLPYAV
jgi:hypothetical protein